MQLQTVELWESGLKAIEDHTVHGLTKLTILDVMDCHVNSPITNFTFDGLKSVQTIDLSLSNISTMEVGALDGLHNQQVLSTIYYHKSPVVICFQNFSQENLSFLVQIVIIWCVLYVYTALI